MYQISNTDFALLLRLLKAFGETKPTTLREQENRRRAMLLRRKMERKLLRLDRRIKEAKEK